MPRSRATAVALALTAAALAVTCQVGASPVGAAPVAAAGVGAELARAELARAEPPPDPESRATAWLQRTYGLTQADAERRLAAERASDVAADGLLGRLGSTAAGAWLEPQTGQLVIDTVDAAAFPAIRAAQARPRLVRHSAGHLQRLKRRLDAKAARSGAGRAASWYVDLPSNALVVNVTDGGPADAFLALARSLGDAVRIRTVTGDTTTYRDLLAGQELETDDSRVCSLGFHARDRAGRPVLLTAGHCSERTSGFSRSGQPVGHVRAARFPGDDFAVVALDNGAEWSARPWVERYDRRPRAVLGHSTAPVGSTVCKSGGATEWTCGRIVAHDVTVNYDDGDTVYGLTQASTCSGGGDSGGPLMAGGYAQGLLSGGQSIGGRCLERYGMESVAYFQPVGEPLSRYGLRLLTTR